MPPPQPTSHTITGLTHQVCNDILVSTSRPHVHQPCDHSLAPQQRMTSRAITASPTKCATISWCPLAGLVSTGHAITASCPLTHDQHTSRITTPPPIAPLPVARTPPP